MNKIISIFEKFKDIKEIKDLLDDIDKLQSLYCSQNFEEMQIHITNIMFKNAEDTVKWNFVNRNFPAENDYNQKFVNASNFLIVQGFKKLENLKKDWRNTLSKEEISFIESMIKPME